MVKIGYGRHANNKYRRRDIVDASDDIESNASWPEIVVRSCVVGRYVVLKHTARSVQTDNSMYTDNKDT